LIGSPFKERAGEKQISLGQHIPHSLTNFLSLTLCPEEEGI
jgi:hypothetical protein